jgi:uncharacterized protein
MPIARRLLLALGFLAPAAAAAQTPPARRVHRLVMQVNDNEPARMNLVLNNAANVVTHYTSMGHEIEIEIVAYGPGLHMLRADTSPVKDRLRSFMQSMPDVVLTACGNTIDNMRRAEGKDIPILDGVQMAQTGVARLMELQEQGWSYVRP